MKERVRSPMSRCLRLGLAGIIASLMVSLASAWSSSSNIASTGRPDAILSRRAWMAESLSVAGAAAVLVSVPRVANADVTNKVASSTAIRNVKRSQRQLDTLELLASTSNYEELKAALRVAPLAEVRKNCFILVRGGEDGPDAERLATSYQKFIQGLELMDSTASLAMRGRKMPDGQLYDNYKVTVAALSEFVKVAEDTASISVQYTEAQ